MRRAGISNKPCHGCGLAIPHATDSVCQFCRDKLTGYDRIMRERAAVPDTIIMVSKSVARSLPYLPRLGAFNDRGSRDDIQQGFLGIVGALSTPASLIDGAPSIFEFNGNPSVELPHEFRCGVRIRRDHGELIGMTYSAVKTAIELAYIDGHRRGRNLLNQLASGEITSDQFNNTAARVEGEQQ